MLGHQRALMPVWRCMTARPHSVLCRYYVHGVCRNGADCPFSHDYNKGQDMVRTPCKR